MSTPQANILDYPELKDVVCVITGAGGGIGQQIARDLARSGAKLMLLEASEAACGAIRAELQGAGVTCDWAVLDVTDAEALKKAAAQSLASLGPCRVLVNTVAISGRPDGLMELSLDRWERQISVNLTSYFAASQIYARQMRDAGAGGSIVHLGSLAGSAVQAQSGAYSVCKSGVAMLSRVMSREWGEFGIRSNVVSPAMVRTQMSECFYSQPGVLEAREQMVPLGQVAGPKEISDAVLFLASPRSAYITGQELLVDGGVSQMLMSLFPGQSARPAAQ